MLRVKVTLVYLVLVGFLVGLVTLIAQMSVSRTATEDAEAALRRSANAVESSATLDEGALLAKAQFVASGDRLFRSLKGEFVTDGETEEKEDDGGAAVADFAGQRHLDAHEKLTAQKYRLDEIVDADANSGTRGLLGAPPKNADIFMVLDDKGVGVAALGKDLYSWFGSDISKAFPVLREVADGGDARVDYWMWSFKPADEKRLYRVAIAPVRRTESEAPAGLVVMGGMLSDGLAARKQRLAAGATSLEKPAEGEAPGYLASAPEIAFFRGDAIVGSTFSASEQASVAASLKEKAAVATEDPDAMRDVTIAETPYLALSRELHGGEAPIRVVLLANVAQATAPLKALRVNILLVGVLFLLVGAALIFFLVVRYMKPIEDLETGMQEVIAGNTDYHWLPNRSHDLQESLANNLNLLSAYLQGKPMPDDDQAGSSWGDLMPGGGDPEPQRPGQVQGIDLGALSAPPPSQEPEDS